MKKHTSKLIALVLALCLCLSLSVSAFAAEIDSSGGSGSTPVNLSSTSDGTEGGDPSATAMRVTVPTALPMAMSQDGDVTTANNCQIVNHSYGAVRVKSVSITAASGWKLTAFGNKSILAGEKVDSNKLGFAISIGGGQQKATDASNANTQTLIDAPIAGCYMTGVGDSSRNSEGSGLGLSIAQSLTELMGGAFRLEIDGDLFKAKLDFPVILRPHG